MSPCRVMEFICYVDWFPWLCSSSVYLVPCENVVFFTALSVRFFGFCFSNMHCIVVSPPSPRPCEGKYLLVTSTYQLYHYLKEHVEQGLWCWRIRCMLEKLNFVIPLAFRSSWSPTGPWTLPPDVQLWGQGRCRLHPCLGPALAGGGVWLLPQSSHLPAADSGKLSPGPKGTSRLLSQTVSVYSTRAGPGHRQYRRMLRAHPSTGGAKNMSLFFVFSFFLHTVFI